MRKSRDNDRLRLLHMLDDAQLALAFVQATDKRTVESDAILKNGLAKTIQDLGEAANQLTDDFKAAHPDIPWRDMTDMRNFIVHAYFDTDLDTMWKTVQEDLPALITQLEAILSDDPSP